MTVSPVPPLPPPPKRPERRQALAQAPSRRRRWLDTLLGRGDVTESATTPRLPSLLTALMIVLLLVDSMVIAGHFVYFVTDWKEPRLLLSYDGGYGELFQYAKFFGLAAVFVAFALTSRDGWWLIWAGVFGFLGLDDSMQFHESVSRWSRNSVGLAGEAEQSPRLLGFRWQDWGEMLVSALAAIVLLSAVLLAYARSDAYFRRLSRPLIGLIILLGAVGVIFDVIQQHTWVKQVRWLHHGLGVVEDGGELLITTGMILVVGSALAKARDGAASRRRCASQLRPSSSGRANALASKSRPVLRSHSAARGVAGEPPAASRPKA